MENLRIEGTPASPSIYLDAKTGKFSIEGSSYPENSTQFFAPIIKWFDLYLSETQIEAIVLNFKIIYSNSSSSQVFYDIFCLMNERAKEKLSIEVNWFYDKENDFNVELANDFMEEFKKIKFTMVEI